MIHLNLNPLWISGNVILSDLNNHIDQTHTIAQFQVESPTIENNNHISHFTKTVQTRRLNILYRCLVFSLWQTYKNLYNILWNAKIAQKLWCHFDEVVRTGCICKLKQRSRCLCWIWDRVMIFKLSFQILQNQRS